LQDAAKMKILVINAGSSSVKFSLFDTPSKTLAASGLVERIGLAGTRFHYRRGGDRLTEPVAVGNTETAVKTILAKLTAGSDGVVASLREIDAVGHRVVHGGERIVAPVRIDADVKAVIRDCFVLAPLHNPPNLQGIEACERLLADTPQVAVFDTAFHAAMPARAYIYGLPYRYYTDAGIRRYGFHGTSHQFVSRKAAAFLGTPIDGLRLITCHLGNGCSMSAVSGGRCIDTSMGMTPLEGLLMGSRCGDLDPSIVFYLMDQHQLDPLQISTLLNKESGLKGLAGIGSSDLRDILAAREAGNRQADLAVEAFVYRIRKYVGAYVAALDGLDALVFTAGIGENAPEIRALVCQELGGSNSLGIAVDPRRNTSVDGQPAEIQPDGCAVKVLVIPTNEEREIAFQTLQVLNTSPGSPPGSTP
jgi:acetate kinase